LAERFTSRSLILWQHLPVWHLRRIVDARHIALALLYLALAALAQLALNLVGPAIRIIWVIGLIDEIAATSSLTTALVGLVGINI
jgi:hypothetical protein